MVIAGLIFAGLAALIHVYIFVLESIVWTTPRARRTFGTTREQAQQTREMAFNQGFYNLFLAVATGLGIILVAVGYLPVGATLVLVGTGSMLAASLVLVLSSPAKARAAAVQGVPPLIAVVLVTVGLVF
jgi:putative membrane protein